MLKISDSEGESKTQLSCPRFTGEYLPWKRQFVLYASVKGFKEAVGRKPDPNPPAEEDELNVTDQTQLKKQKVSIRKNCLAMNQLYLAFKKTKSLCASFKAPAPMNGQADRHTK